MQEPAAAAPAAPPGDAATTIGVEEEFLLVDDAGAMAPRAAEVLARAAADSGAPRFQPELFRSQLEVASGVCTSTAELERQLSAARARLAAVADAAGLRVLATGMPPLPGTPRLTSGDRYERLAGMFAAVAAEHYGCGCHVHVGLADRELAVGVLNRLRPWLPVLLALSVNSPLHLGSDTGYGSWRTVQQSRFPVWGVPPRFASAADYERQVATLVECGAALDAAQTYWLARLSPHLPTIEFRVADTALTAREAAAQAALARALVRTALADLRAGRAEPQVAEHVARGALWRAARFGLSGDALHAAAERRVPAVELVRRLLVRVRPALAEAGDAELVDEHVALLVRCGTGAQRQRAAAASGRRALLELLSLRSAAEPADIPAARGEPD